MSRRPPPDDIYEKDSFYEEVDRRRRSKDDRYFDPEFGVRRRRLTRSPPAVREIDERVRVRRRDSSAPDIIRDRDRFVPPRDEEVISPRRRERERLDDLRVGNGCSW